LSDLSNLTMPWTVTQNFAEIKTHAHPAFATPGSSSSSTPPGLPTKAQCLEWYREAAALDIAHHEIRWADAFAIFRTAVMIQGIAARHAVRQASGEGQSAAALAQERFPYARAALEMVREFKDSPDGAKRGRGEGGGGKAAAGVGGSRL